MDFFEELEQQYANAPIQEESGEIIPPTRAEEVASEIIEGEGILAAIRRTEATVQDTMMAQTTSSTGYFLYTGTAGLNAMDATQWRIYDALSIMGGISHPVATPTPIDQPEEPVEVKDCSTTDDLDKLLADTKQKILDLFIEHYGDKYVSSEEGSSNIMVHHPKITVRNEVDESHVITDLYLKYRFSIYIDDNKVLVDLNKIGGTRATFTLEEFVAEYSFSHLSETPERWGWFCYGSEGAIGDLVSVLSFEDYNDSHYDEDEDTDYKTDFVGSVYNYSNLDTYLEEIESLLFLTDEYLTWESINTNPYKYMSSIGSGNRFNNVTISSGGSFDSSVKNFVNALLGLILVDNRLRDKFIDDCIISTDNEFSMDVYRTSMFLDDLLKEDYQYPLLTKFEYDPVTFIVKSVKTSSGVPVDSEGFITNGDGKFYFKGEAIKRRIINYAKEETDDDKLTVINPQFVAGFISQTLQLFKDINYYGEEIRTDYAGTENPF